MNLRYTAEEQQFRAELRSWLQSVLPSMPAEPALDDWQGRRIHDTRWQRMLFDAGYAGINWPKEFGGRGASPSEQLIFLEESERAHAPYVGVNFVGLLHAGPTLIAEASPQQQQQHLPAILKGEEVWCQGFSEPGAGSDLASLRTRAVRDGDDYEYFCGRKRRTSYVEAFTAGSQGHALWPELDVAHEDLIILKSRFGAFVPGSSDLHVRLQERGIDTLIISGTLSHVCCDTTAGMR